MADTRRLLDIEFERKRDRAIFEAERRKQELFRRIPELSDIDAELSLAGIRYAQSLLNEDTASCADEYLSKIDMLTKKREHLLLANNIPLDYLEPAFSCKACEDRGYVSKNGATYPCSCYNKLYLEHLYRISNILDDGKTGFGHFDEKWYSDKTDPKKYAIDISPRAQIQAVKEQCLEFVSKFTDENTKNLYFYGPTGTGKTFMAKSIGLELLRAGFSVLYFSAANLFQIIHKYRLNIDEDGLSGEQAYKDLITANLLILDDLGTEPKSDSKYAELLALLEQRNARNRICTAKTIIASNLDFKRLVQEYNQRIGSRIIGEFQTLQFAGDDIRIMKKLSGF
ncbi:MAG TPA: ATP-binding protein [Clostridiaceae bacterium]|nr:ATP-binding protein [Clostridiaceae bacterium]